MASPTGPVSQTVSTSEPGDASNVNMQNGSDTPPRSPTSGEDDANQGADAHDSSPSHMGPPIAKTTNGKKSTLKVDEDKASAATAVGAAAASQQPKVVQTAFIHKLYNMLEDTTIQHLISWSASGESFLISPSSEFSRVLSSYFKHTNVSSFVRQLNMYGFHKVSDVFQTGSPDSPLWEFKHGGGNFKRGDLSGLREIKRRASRHTLIHRDSFSQAQRGPPAAVAGPPAAAENHTDSTESRLGALEGALWDVHSRLARSEDALTQMSVRCHSVHEHLVRALQVRQAWFAVGELKANFPPKLNHDMSSLLLDLTVDKRPSVQSTGEAARFRTAFGYENSQSHEASALQSNIAARLDLARRDQDSFYGGFASARVGLAGNEDTVSPRQHAQPESRLDPVPSLTQTSQPAFYRPLAPSSAAPPRTLGSFSGTIPSTSNHPPPPAHMHMQPVHQHPLAAMPTSIAPGAASASPSSSFVPRRHTSADIRSDGWTPDRLSRIAETTTSSAQRSAPPGSSSAQWSLPNYNRPPDAPRDVLSRPQLNEATESAPSTPPHAKNLGESRWYAIGGKLPFKDVFKNTGVGHEMHSASPTASGPPTRRSSVANIHMMLNHNDVAERESEDRDDNVDEFRKRKRLE